MWTNLIELIETMSRMSIEALLNGLWQGVALTLVIWAMIRVAPRIHPRGRFAIWSATLAVIVCLPFVTGQKLLPSAVAQYFVSGDFVSGSSNVASDSPAIDGATGRENFGEQGHVLFADSPTTFAVGTTDNSSSKSRTGPLGGASQSAIPVTDFEKSGYSKSFAGSIARSSPSVSNVGDNTTSDKSNQFAAGAVSNTTLETQEDTLLSFVLSRTMALGIFGLWLMVSVFLLLRLVYSYWRLQELQASAIEAPEKLQRQFSLWMDKQEINRDVSLLISSDISVPLAVGFGSPAVILPQGILSSLTDAEFDLVIVHELAHLKRRDDWSVFWQQVAQALFFVNPATFWIASRMDFEREVACDNEVIAHIGSPRKYAACLARLAELATVPRHSVLVAGTFIRKNRLVERVERLLSSATYGNSRFSRATVIASFVVLTLALAQFTLIPAIVAIEGPGDDSEDNDGSYEIYEVYGNEGSIVVAPSIRSGEGIAAAMDDASHKRDRILRKYEGQRRSAEEQISSLRVALAELQDKTAEQTPERQARLRTFRRSLDDYTLKLERLSKKLSRVSTGRGFFGSGGIIGAIGPVTLVAPTVAIFPTVPSRALAIVSAPRSVPSIRTFPTVPVIPSAPAVIVSSRNSNGINISFPKVSFDGVGNWNFDNEDGGVMNFNWSDGRHKIQVRAQGEIEFRDDESDVLSISDNGYFSVHERDRGLDREYEVLADEDGELDKTYYVDGRRTELDDEAKVWVGESILFLLRNSSVGAKDRAARILKNDGIVGLLKEIEFIESDYVKRSYYSASFASGEMSATQIRAALAHIVGEIDSDYEKAQILSEIDESALSDDETLVAYVAVVNSIDSDYEKRRALETVLSRQDIPKDVMLGLLLAAKDFDSDYERAQLLSALAEDGFDDDEVVEAYTLAIDGIDSDYEKRRALEAITKRKNLNKETVLAILKMARSIDSDYERAELLSDMSRFMKDDDILANAYYDALVDIDSNYEKRRVLSKLMKRRTLSEEMALNILDLARTIDSDYERAELLIDMTRFNEGQAAFYKAYVAALKDIDSDYDTQRALNRLDLDNGAPKQALLSVLSVIDGFSSDYEKAGALEKIAELYTADETLFDAFVAVADRIDSDYEQDRVFAALYRYDRFSDHKSSRRQFKRRRITDSVGDSDSRGRDSKDKEDGRD